MRCPKVSHATHDCQTVAVFIVPTARPDDTVDRGVITRPGIMQVSRKPAQHSCVSADTSTATAGMLTTPAFTTVFRSNTPVINQTVI